jgi:hypothetical protein
MNITATKQEVEHLAFFLLNDDDGINASGWNVLAHLMERVGSNMGDYVEATDGRFYLKEAAVPEWRNKLGLSEKISVQLIAIDKDTNNNLSKTILADTLEELRKAIADFRNEVPFRKFMEDFVTNNPGNFTETEIENILDETE